MKMDREKVKYIIHNMELLLDSLKAEFYGKQTYSFDDVDYSEEDDEYWDNVTS
jgi:hypothetical protein